jgi:hypothetical protein
MSNFKELTKVEKTAVLSSGFIISALSAYWLYQVYNTLEFLKMAYG